MSEFWALVLGAALAALGGMAATFFSYLLQRKNEKNSERKEAYKRLLEIIYFMYSGAKLNPEEDAKLTSESLALASLYGSKDVRKAYNNVVQYISTCDRKNMWNDEGLRSLTGILTGKMRKELDLPKYIRDEAKKKIDARRSEVKECREEPADAD